MARVYPRRDPVDRFWSKVNKDGPVHPSLGTACWIWGRASPGSRTYGRIDLFRDGKRRIVGAHCFSWELHNGPIPAGLFVLHRCDVRPCCNPDHLFLGTSGDNLRDAAAKGRIWGQGKTHCPQGHRLAGDNLVKRPGKRGRWRDCKTCHREKQRARVYATPGLLAEISRKAREWRIKNPEKAKAADARGIERRRQRNLAKKRAAHPAA